MARKMIGFVSGFALSTLILATLCSISTAQEALPPLKVVHLGDSYSAGNGARTEAGERNYHGVSGCYRSPTNWGSQFVESLKDTFSVTYVNRACSGGVIANITIDRFMKDGVPLNDDGSCPAVEFPDEEFYEKIADPSISGYGCGRFKAPN